MKNYQNSPKLHAWDCLAFGSRIYLPSLFDLISVEIKIDYLSVFKELEEKKMKMIVVTKHLFKHKLDVRIKEH